MSRPLALGDFRAQREFKSSYAFQILRYHTSKLQIVPVLFAANRCAICLKCQTGKLCVGRGIRDDEIRLELGFPYMDLFHCLDVAELCDAIMPIDVSLQGSCEDERCTFERSLEPMRRHSAWCGFPCIAPQSARDAAQVLSLLRLQPQYPRCHCALCR